jgi:hypothetical protein
MNTRKVRPCSLPPSGSKKVSCMCDRNRTLVLICDHAAIWAALSCTPWQREDNYKWFVCHALLVRGENDTWLWNAPSIGEGGERHVGMQ